MILPSIVFVEKRETINLTITTDLVSLCQLQRVEEIDALDLMIAHAVLLGVRDRCKALYTSAGSLDRLINRAPFI